MRTKKKIRVLLLSSRGSVSLGRVEALRSYPGYTFTIIGADSSSDPFKLPGVEKQEKIPVVTSPEFIPALKRIVKRNKIDVIVPVAEREVVQISRHKKEFETLNAACVCSNGETTWNSNHKGIMFETLAAHGITVPKFYRPTSQKELERAVHQLGYPKAVILKPSYSGGANRGVWRIQEDFSDELLGGRGLPTITLSGLLAQIKRLPTFPDIVVMEYLSGTEYSTDGLSKDGVPIYVVPRRRVTFLPGHSREGVCEKNKKVEEYVRSIARVFSFDSIFNVQVIVDKKGEPKVFEVNPRDSATVVANAAGGIDLFIFSILQALNLPYPTDLKQKPARMIRFWKEFYV